MKPLQSGYAPVNSMKIYYEVFSTGDPLILLHGGFGAIDMFQPILPALAAKRKVIAVDLQGHGRTLLTDRPLTIEAMADDISALLKYMNIEKADIMGYSMGGIVAIQMVIRHPEQIRKAVFVSTVFKKSGWYPEMDAAMQQIGPASAEEMKATPLYQLYSSQAPQPGDWTKLHIQMGELLRRDFDWSADIKKIKLPVMIIAGDADGTPPAQSAAFFALVGGGLKDGGWDGSGITHNRLAILPGLTHYNTFASPAMVAAALPFLDEPVAK